ncbi:signal peptidase II [bacterium]|nr:signal peptidase II [bacterium]
MQAPRDRKTPYETFTFYLLAFSTLLLDQFAKFGIVAALALGQSHPLVDGFLHLTYVRNFGAAFSLFWGHTPFLSVVAGAIALGVVAYQWRTKPSAPMVVCSLGLLLGGALGNFVDRLAFGYVRDMVDLRWQGQNVWPIFNVADVAVLAGVGIMLLHAYRTSREEAHSAS